MAFLPSFSICLPCNGIGIKILLAVDGIDINVKDKDEKTPFDLAKTEEIKALLKKAAEKTTD